MSEVVCPICEWPIQNAQGECRTCGWSPGDEATQGSFDSPSEVRGLNGQVSFDGNIVSISRKGFLGFASQGMKGTKQIPLTSLSSIQFKKAGALFNGYIQFATGAGEGIGGLKQATSDENTLIFTLGQAPQFEALYNQIMAAWADRSKPTTRPTAATEPSAAEQLEKLATMYERGLLSDEEFRAAKAKLLSN